MDSRIFKMPDVHREVQNWPWKTDEANASTQEQVYQVCLKHKYYEAQTEIEDGDIVTLKMESAVPKYNRTLPLRVGANLFDKTLEADLIGRGIQESYVFSCEAGDVNCTIQNISRLVVPGLSDEIALAEEIPEITTAKQLYAHFYDEAVSSTIYDQYFDFQPVLFGEGQFQISEQDIAEMIDSEMERCREIGKEMGVVFEEMSEQALMQAVGCPTIPAFKEMLHDIFTRIIKGALMYSFIEKINPASIPTDKMHENYYKMQNMILKLAKETKEAIPT